MELLVAYIVGAALIVAPFALWVYVRRARWRRPGRAVGLAYLSVLAVEIVAVGMTGYLYPFGFPGPEERAWRAAAIECANRYAAARTPHDSAVVDAYVHRSDTAQIVPTCYTFRVNRLTSAARRCGPGSRCARLRQSLSLPSP